MERLFGMNKIREIFKQNKSIDFEYAYKKSCSLVGLDRFYSISKMSLGEYKRGYMYQMVDVYSINKDVALEGMESWIESFVPRSEWKELTFDSGVDDAKESVSYWSE